MFVGQAASRPCDVIRITTPGLMFKFRQVNTLIFRMTRENPVKNKKNVMTVYYEIVRKLRKYIEDNDKKDYDVMFRSL